MENNIFNDFENLNVKINRRKTAMQELYDLSDEVKAFVKFQQETSKLEEVREKMEPEYYATAMQCCNHLFAECSHRYYEYETKDGDTDYSAYDLFVNHYCLKCGCATAEIKPFYFEKYGITDTPTAKVPYQTQLKIAQNSTNYSIIDCGEFNLYILIQLWKKIKEDNQELTFEELVCIFQSKVEEIKSHKEFDSKKLVKYPIVHEIRYIQKK
ncbi:MAG: hypothetical protein ACI33S_04110 [Bacilli bacterium]